MIPISSPHPDDINETFERVRRQQISSSGSWSPENPYVEQMMYAKNRQDMAALREKAIEWEANLQQYQMQLSDQERLSDPHYQLARQRAAGLNPDIAGGSGSGGTGASVSPPAMADTELTEMSSPYKTADRIFTGIQSAGSLLTSVSSAMLQGFEFVKNVATFGDMLSMSDSSKRAAQAAADVAESTVQPQIDSLNQLAAGGKLELFGKIAESLPDVEGGHTVESISKYLADLGIDTGYADGVYSYTQSPSQQQLRASQKAAAVKARANEAAATYDHWLRVEHNQAAFRESQSLSDFHMANFQKILSMNAFSEEQALDQAAIIVQGRENERLETSYTHDQLVEDIQAWKAALKQRREQILKLDKMIEQYSGSISPAAQAIVSSSMVYRSQLLSLTSSEFYQIANIGQQVGRMQFVADVAMETDGSQTVLPGWKLVNQHNLNFYDMAFPTDWVNDPDGGLKAVDRVFDVMKFALKKTPQGRVGSAAISAVTHP